MPKLTDTQLVILSAAGQREDGAALPLPKSLKIKGAAVTRTLDSLRKNGFLEEKPAPREADSWREDPDGRRMMLAITDAGLQAIDGEPAGEAASRRTSTKSRSNKSSTKGRTPPTKRHGQSTASTARQNTKQTLLISLLEREDGATMEEIVEATGWQAHSVRGAISGALKKKLGLAVTSQKVEGRGRVYRIFGRG